MWQPIAEFLFVESVTDSMDEKQKVARIFMDLFEAFDSISHAKMINKHVEITETSKTQILKYQRHLKQLLFIC